MIELVNTIPEVFQRVPSQANVTREWREAIAAQVHFATEEKLRHVLATVAVRAELDTGSDADADESSHKDEVQSFFERTSRLFLSSTRLVLVNPEGSSVIIAYPSIILHSVIANPPEVYCQLDLTDIRLDGRSIELREDAFLELHLGVDDPIELYEALCECACLHPGESGGDESEGEDKVTVDNGESEYKGGYSGSDDSDEDRPAKLACYDNDDAEK